MGIEDLTKEAAATLRDMMAMSAMSGMVCGEWMPSEEIRQMTPLEVIAAEAYKMADAMLEAR